MKATEEMMRFYLDFTKEDLDAMREGRFIDFKEDFTSLLSRQNPNIAFAPSPLCLAHADQFTRQYFSKLQIEVRKIFDDLVNTRNFTTGTMVIDEVPVDCQFALIGLSDKKGFPKGRSILSLNGTPRDVFLMILYFLLSQNETDRIRKCPVCGLLFYRTGKELYCSHRCGNRKSKQTWRSKRVNRLKESEKAKLHTKKKANKKGISGKHINKPIKRVS